MCLKNSPNNSKTCLKKMHSAAIMSSKNYPKIETTINRTNIIVEGLNKKFSKLVGQKHPTIWKLIRKIKNEITAD